MSAARIRIGSKQSDWLSFDTLKEFSRKLKELKTQKANITGVDECICNFWYSRSDYGISDMLRRGNPLTKGYLAFQSCNGDLGYHTGSGFTRFRINARIFSKAEADRMLQHDRQVQYIMPICRTEMNACD